jgi:hypothetical protein
VELHRLGASVEQQQEVVVAPSRASSDLVVLAVGVVVALLVRPNSSPASSIGTPCDSSSVARSCAAGARAAPARRVVGRALDAAVPRQVVVVAVAVVLAVGLVVLVVVADEVGSVKPSWAVMKLMLA